ncbi:restriction endonuclease subunit S [Vreelandella alkaliphila]|uniref:Restriction endonuclease subunit S n=1 Tax=Vreelandella alkaliphila TaxID=272774 RepID=A0A7C9NQF5_9GAMM|nr:restriction endonuclease subunit S [Halomonas alkaliphila]NDL70167.1 restriction endonuclease subunit S [Halomonas alkaliphila]
MSQASFPKSWVEIPLGEMNQYQSQNVQPKDSPDEIFELWSVPIFPAGKPETVSGYEIGSSKQAVAPRDVLICKINPRINRVWEVGEKDSYRQIASSEWIVVRQPQVESRYLLRFFQSSQFRLKLCADVTGVGGSLTRAQPKKVAVFPVTLPPIAEQKIIADKLDTLLTQVENTKARLERIPQILKRFRQSVLAAAVSGRLTREWRATHHQNIGDVKPLSVAGKIIAGQSPSRSEVNFDGRGEPYVTGPEQWDGRKILHNKWTEYPKRMAPDGSIFVTVKGAGVGTTFPGCYAAIGRDVYAFVPNEKMNYTYILFAIQASAADVVLKAKGLIPGLTKSNIIDHEIYLPPLKEQTEIVRRVEQLFAYADRIEQQVNQALVRVKNLTQSILAKAFRGELTEQWRKDNPELISGENSAEALLERIKAERAAKAPAKRTRKKAFS